LNEAYVEMGATFGFRPRKELSPLAVEQLADLDPAADKILARRLDVGDDQLQPLNGARLRWREAPPERDRALRVRRPQLHSGDVADVEVGVQPPPKALVEALCPVQVRDGQRHDLELHANGSHFRALARGIGAHAGGAHYDLRRSIATGSRVSARPMPSRP
jgi:hypothetical protein